MNSSPCSRSIQERHKFAGTQHWVQTLVTVYCKRSWDISVCASVSSEVTVRSGALSSSHHSIWSALRSD